ncbi:MAG: flagellar motor switch protein FliN [Candidatus Poribacteria bacterium]|nr:flagellar motor switch protein FliN [Candidatus Poribacteria bacterium]
MNQDEIDAILNGAVNSSPKKSADVESQMIQDQQIVEKDRQFIQEEQVSEPKRPLTQQIGGTNIEILLDIPLEVSVELGRTKIVIRDLVQLGPGSIIELDKLIGEPVDLLVNDNLIARGEVVVFDENFGIRITDIVTPTERLKSLR